MQVLETIIFATPSSSISSDMEQYEKKFLNASLTGAAAECSFEQPRSMEILKWTFWQTGMAFSHKGRTLVVIKQEDNKPCDELVDTLKVKSHLLKSVYRIEIHIYTNEWVALTNELMEQSSRFMDNFEFIPGLATKLLVTVTSHVKALTSGFFQGMLTRRSRSMDKKEDFESITYLPCWKCYAEIESSNPRGKPNVQNLMVASFQRHL